MKKILTVMLFLIATGFTANAAPQFTYTHTMKEYMQNHTFFGYDLVNNAQEYLTNNLTTYQNETSPTGIKVYGYVTRILNYDGADPRQDKLLKKIISMYQNRINQNTGSPFILNFGDPATYWDNLATAIDQFLPYLATTNF